MALKDYIGPQREMSVVKGASPKCFVKIKVPECTGLTQRVLHGYNPSSSAIIHHPSDAAHSVGLGAYSSTRLA